MDSHEQIQRAKDFLDEVYEKKINDLLSKGQSTLIVDFGELIKHDPEMSDEILESPEDAIRAFELAMEGYETKNFKVRFTNLPQAQYIAIRNIRSLHLDKLMYIEGIVRQSSDVRPQVTSARFECPSCGNTITILQIETRFKEPTRCTCGRRGKFRLLSKDLVDAQRLVLEESPESLEGGEQPKRLSVFLKEDLVEPKMEKKTTPGSKVRVYGIVKEVPILLRTGAQSIRYDLMMDSNYIEPIDEAYQDIEINPEEEKEILELSKDERVYERFIQSIAPSIYGHDDIKEAILLQLMGGVRKQKEDGTTTRGDLHILLCGDPGSGKCLEGNSKVVLNDGSICKIKEIVEGSKSKQVEENGFKLKNNLSVISLGKDARVSTKKSSIVWKRSSPKTLLKIRTSTGNEIICTKNHPLFLTDYGFVYAKEAESLRVGEFIATPRKIAVRAKLQRLPVEFQRSRARNRIQLKIQEYLDENIARFLGYLLGEGWGVIKEKKAMISITNNDSIIMDFCRDIISKKFGANYTIRDSHKGKSSKELYSCSIELARFLYRLNPSFFNRSRGKEIPQIINKSPDKIVKSFLRAFFDAEAHVVKNKREIELSSASKSLVSDLRILLLRWGILSQIHECMKYASNTTNKTPRRYYRLAISGINISKYDKEIGFSIKHKKDSLNKLINSGKIYNTNLDIIPNLSSLLRDLRHSHNLSQFSFPLSRSTYQHYEKGDRNPSREKLNLVLEKYKELNSKDKRINLLSEIANCDIFWDKLVEIEEVVSKEDYVYDLQVDTTHNYVSNSIIVHNSQLLTFVSKLAPKARFVSGKGTSGAGISASVVKDEFLKGWALEAGALVLANKGICCIDELDKMTVEDTSAMHEAMEQQRISISKANIQATLRSETTVLAAANPKLGRFDPYAPIASQINLPPALINRFDLIFPVRDIPNREKDKLIASHVLKLQQKPSELKSEVPSKLFRKYISYAKNRINPALTDAAIDEIMNFYVELRNSGSAGEGGIRPIPISARQLEALVRLAEGSARVRLSKKVTRVDSKRSIRLLKNCLMQVGIDPETGQIDIDRISTGISSSQRSRIVSIREIIFSLDKKLGKNIPIEEIIAEAAEKGIDEVHVQEAIEKLKREGEIFEPKSGHISKM